MWLLSQWWCWFSHSVVSNSCDPMDCSPPGSSVHGVLQARIPEWVAISLSRGSSRPRNQIWVSWTAGRFFTDWTMREPFIINKLYYLLLINADSSYIPFYCLTESFRGDKNDVLYFSKIYLWRCFTQGNNCTVKGKTLPRLNCINRWSLRTFHKNDSVVLLNHSVHWTYDYK